MRTGAPVYAARVISSAVIDVAIALVLTFALTAMAASAVVEWIGNLTKKRAKYLLRGLRNMLDAAGDTTAATEGKPRTGDGVRTEKALYQQALEPTGQDIQALRQSPTAVAGGLTALLFDHPLLRSMMQPTRSATATRSRVPPYVSSEVFAHALLDTLVPRDARPLVLDEVRAAVLALSDKMPAKAALLALLNQTQTGLDEFVGKLENWYDAQMDRVSGWYKRWAKRWIIVVAAVLCIGANVDAYAVARTLYADPVLRTGVIAEVQQGRACGAAGQQPQDQVACVRGVVDAANGPGLVLWPRACLSHVSACVAQPGQPAGGGDWLLKLLGLAVTVAAASMGAPFWFDVLNRLVNLRSTGKIPAPATQPR